MDSHNRAQLFAKGADSTLALLVYAAAAIALMVLDRRLGYLNDVRATAQSVARPIWALAELPKKALDASRIYLTVRGDLEQKLRQQSEISLRQNAEIGELRAKLEEASQVRALLGEDKFSPAQSLVARVLSVDLDRYSQRIAIGRGSRDGVVMNSVLIDERGLLGQITEVGTSTSVAILLTDVNHRVPAELQRNGLRFYVVGLGAGGQLALDRIALNSDIKVGDRLKTSGMGGVFPPGLAIGEVVAVRHAAGDSFARAELKPLAKMALNTVVLVLAPRPNLGPLFAPESAPADAAAATPPSSSARKDANASPLSATGGN